MKGLVLFCRIRLRIKTPARDSLDGIRIAFAYESRVNFDVRWFGTNEREDPRQTL